MILRSQRQQSHAINPSSDMGVKGQKWGDVFTAFVTFVVLAELEGVNEYHTDRNEGDGVSGALGAVVVTLSFL